MNKIKFLLLLATLIKETIPQSCSNISSSYGIKWPTSSRGLVLSQPPCVNNRKEFSYRECSNGEWQEEPECCYVQFENPPQCPDGFIYDQLCYTIVPKSKFPPKCPFEDVLPFDEYRDVLEDVIKTGDPIWMPVHREVNDGLGFLRWIEASTLYKTDFEDKYYFRGGIKDKNCLIYYNNSYIEAVSCEEEHIAICAYDELDQLTDQLCKNDDGDLCCQSDFSGNSACFCQGGVVALQSNVPKAEFVKPYQNNVYRRLTEDVCMIGLEKVNETYIWTTSKQEINYTFWSSEVVFDDSNIYGMATPNGWILNETPVDCVLYQRDRNNLEPKLELDFNGTSFVVSVINPRAFKKRNNEVLLYCFTNAGPFNLLYRYPILTNNTYSDNLLRFTFEPHQYGPGHYWCEAFRYVDVKVIKTRVIFLRQKIFSNEFIGIFKVSYIRGTNPLSKQIIEILERVFCIRFSEVDQLKYYNARFMRILSLDEDTNVVWVNIHFTSRYHKQNLDNMTEYNRVKELIHQSLNLDEFYIEMVKFLSPDYCAKEISKGLTWPQVNNGSVATSKEFCFKKDGTRLNRLCIGDFINGARWSIIGETCEIYNHSSITQKLLKVIDNDTDVQNDVMTLQNISRSYQFFNSLDLYLIGKIFTTFADNIDLLDLEAFCETVSNILEIDKKLFSDSQRKLKTTYRILDAISQIVAGFSAPIEIQNDNFYLHIANLQEFSGVLVHHNHSITKIEGKYDKKDIEEQDDVESAIWISPDLWSKLDDKSVIVKTVVFAKDSFFNEIPLKESSSVVLSITFFDFHEILDGPIWLLHSNHLQSTEVCSCWSYWKSVGSSWKNDSECDKNSPFLFCQFQKTSFFALNISPAVFSVTDDLMSILNNNSFTTSDVISNLVDISTRYDEFNVTDVALVGEILKKVSSDPNVDLEDLAEIVSNIHLVDRETLQNSQLTKGATDTILYYVDEIMKNHNYTSPVNATSDNFLILVTDTKRNISGLMLLDYNETLKVQVLGEDEDIEDVANYDNLDSAVWLSSQLTSQMENDNKVIITVFINDALFNEETPKNKYVSKIFGVILPDVGNYSGPISVLHKVTTSNQQQQCVHWQYNATTDYLGSWLHDHDGQELSSLVHCEFWHTTHFALLLLGDDDYESQLLDWITAINCALSCFGLFFIILTAILFRRWRSNTGNQILLNFVFAEILQIGLFYVSNAINQTTDDHLVCTIIGVVLHYSMISVFCWMFVIAILQFKRFVQVFGGPPKYVLLKGCVCGWILPVVPVATVYFLDSDNYVSGHVGLCYPSGLGLYFGVWLPIGIIVFINIITFMIIIYSVFHRKTECGDVGNSERMSQLRLALLLFFMLGLTWTFGFLSELDFGEVFVYIFCITATLQGFVMFLFFIVFNISTRYLYAQALKRCCCNEY